MNSTNNRGFNLRTSGQWRKHEMQHCCNVCSPTMFAVAGTQMRNLSETVKAQHSKQVTWLWVTTAPCSKCASTLSHWVNNLQRMLKLCTNITVMVSHSLPALIFTLSGKGTPGTYGKGKKLRICDTFPSTGLFCSRWVLPSGTLRPHWPTFSFLCPPYVILCDKRTLSSSLHFTHRLVMEVILELDMEWEWNIMAAREIYYTS